MTFWAVEVVAEIVAACMVDREALEALAAPAVVLMMVHRASLAELVELVDYKMMDVHMRDMVWSKMTALSVVVDHAHHCKVYAHMVGSGHSSS